MGEPPAPLVLRDGARVGALAAELIRNRLVARAGARLLLDTGPATAPMYSALRGLAAQAALPSERAVVLALDEHAGRGPDDALSVAHRLRAELQGIGFGALRTLDGAASDLEAEARRHETEVEIRPVDLAVLALDADGGVALDQPPARLASGVRVVDVAHAPGEPGARRALTVGLGTLWRARELVVLATGSACAPALRSMLERAPSTDSPASLLRDHPRLTIVCDREAASLLAPRPQYGSTRVLVVLGHREPAISVEHRISAESRARLRHALRIARRTPVRAVVLTGYTTTGGLSEAEQMKASWDEHVAPAVLEVAGRNTAENAARSLPIILAIGEAAEVTVVSSAWHLRVPLFFAPYRDLGLRVSYRASFTHGNWPRMLREELRSLPRVRAQRAAAMLTVPRPAAGEART